ncbi:MAG: glycosyltransferase [Clostridia bacterium]|nr:glycosyltransferase [Clostridia bacterium]
MKKPKLSIVLPVYNTEKYVRKCLESIFASDFQDFELILINNASKDGSEQILLEFKEKYEDKIIYLKREDCDISEARNLGIEKATGKYITFIDSDDYIEKDMLSLMVDKIDSENFDMVACDVKLVYEAEDKVNTLSSGYEQDLFHKDKIKQTMLVYYPVMWNKVYKTEIIKSVKFTKGVWYEDMEYLLRLYPAINSIGAVKKSLYNYLQRKNSITYTYNDKLYDIINNMENVIKYYKEKGIYDEYKDEIEYLYARYAFTTFPKRLSKCKNKEKYNKGIEFAFKKVKENFPDYKSNRYLSTMGAKGIYIKHFNKLLAKVNYMVQNGKKYN